MKCPAWPLSCFADLPPLSLQVNFNEPLSMLQRLTEDLEYHELLDKAVKCESSTEQMCFVAAFSVSSYSTTVHRTAKPFNPLLGETYELDRLEEFGFRSLCEQVRHGLRAHQAAALCRCSCPAKVAPSPKETQHLLVLSLPPGRDSQRGAPGTGRSSSKHNLSYLQEQEHCVAVPALQSRRWGGKKREGEEHLSPWQVSWQPAWVWGLCNISTLEQRGRRHISEAYKLWHSSSPFPCI